MTTHPATPDQSNPVGKTPATPEALISELEYAILGAQFAGNFDRIRAAKDALRAALSVAAPAVAPKGHIWHITRGQLRGLIAELQVQADAHDGDPTEADETELCLSFSPAGTVHDDERGLNESPLLTLWEAEYPEEGVYPIDPSTCRSPEPPAAQPESFQQRVQPWMMKCFGPMIAGDREERNHRFIEEALELVQSTGCSASEAHQLVDYVYGRPVGEPAQEVGGVMVTLAALCLANKIDMHSAAEVELARIWTKVDAIRAKQAAKPKHSPLPMAAGPGSGVEQDAARYRWLRRGQKWSVVDGIGDELRGDALDAAVDKVLAAKGQEGGSHG